MQNPQLGVTRRHGTRPAGGLPGVAERAASSHHLELTQLGPPGGLSLDIRLLLSTHDGPHAFVAKVQVTLQPRLDAVMTAAAAAVGPEAAPTDLVSCKVQKHIAAAAQTLLFQSKRGREHPCRCC